MSEQEEGLQREVGGEESLRALFAQAGVGLATMTSEGRFLEVSPAVCALVGYSDRELRDLDLAAITHPDDRRSVAAFLHRLNAREIPSIVAELRLRSREGREVWVKANMVLGSDSARTPARIVAMVEDLTPRKRDEASIAELRRLADYGRDVGLALTSSGSLEEILSLCAQATVRHLDGAFARVWTVNETRDVLELTASAGQYTHTNGDHARIPVGKFKIGRIAQQRQPHLTNSVIGDPQIPAQEWAKAEGMVAFAGYPLVVGDRLVGVIAMFARQELSEATLRAMESVADEIALGVERRRAEEHLHRHQEWLRVTLESIGDAIIATDTAGRVTFMNSVAATLTGWTHDEARDQPLPQVFRIINEQTREPVPNPVEHAIHDGVIVGLANHTVLISRDGREYPIDDSAAPIRDQHGGVMGAVLIFRDVTERRRAELELEQNESRKSAILNTALDAIVMMDHRGNVVEWNPAAEMTFGYSRQEAVGREMCELIIPPSLRDSHRRGLAHFLDTGDGPVLGRRFEITAVDAGGRTFPIELAIAELKAQGSPLFTAHLRDVTERVETLKALQESEERFRHLADALPQVVWESDADGTVAYFNQRWYEYTGLTPEQALEQDGWRWVVHPEDLPTLERLREQLLDGGQAEVFEAEYRLRDHKGAYRWHLGRAVPLFGGDGRVIRRYGTATDIDDRKRAENTARFLADASAALAVLVDDEETLRRVASMAVPAFADWCAVDVLDESGQARRLAVAHLDPDRLQLAHEIFEKFPPHLDDPQGIGMVLRTGESEIGEEITDEELAVLIEDPHHLELIRKLSLRSYLCVPLRPRGARPGALTFVTAGSGRHYTREDLRVAEDLARRATVAIENAELYRALQAANRQKDELLVSLRDNEERFRTMAESIPQLAWMARPDGHIFWYNKRWHEYTGVPPEEMEGWAWQSVHDPEMLPMVLQRWKASIATGDPFDMTFPLRGADGRFRPFLTRIMPVRDDQGRVTQWFGTNTDISDQLRVEEELRAAKEEAEAANQAKTQFLAVLSHELRTPLNPILLAASSMLERPGDPGELRPTLEMIRQNVLLQARLIDDLLDVMRIVRGKMPLHWEVADCHKLIQQAVQVCRSEVLGHELKLTIEPRALRHHVNADPARLQQVFWNLIKNSVKFTPEGGNVTVRTSNQRDEATGEEVILIDVTDNGIGIESDVLPKIFDPFQQGETTITRKFGGLGLGLAICKGVVEAHGGTITAISPGRGRGTTFRVALKVLPESVAEASDRARAESPKRGNASQRSLRILAVEDEPTTLRLMARLLRGLGHEVATAGSVAEAVRLYESEAIDLIISDIGLPDGTGLDLVRKAVALKGVIPAIALTGYGMEEDIRRSREAGFTAHLTKPIDFAKLEAMIRQVAT